MHCALPVGSKAEGYLGAPHVCEATVCHLQRQQILVGLQSLRNCACAYSNAEASLPVYCLSRRDYCQYAVYAATCTDCNLCV